MIFFSNISQEKTFAERAKKREIAKVSSSESSWP